MLILTRRVTESVTIGIDVRVVVLGVRGHKCALGLRRRKRFRYTGKRQSIKSSANTALLVSRSHATKSLASNPAGPPAASSRFAT